MVHNIYHSPVQCCIDDDERLPLEAVWPEPEDEEWTVVERVHRGLRGTKGVDSDRFHNFGENLDNPGMGCDELDYFDKTNNLGIRSGVMPSNRREVTQSDNPPTEVERVTKSATTSVKPAVYKRPNVIVVVPSMTTSSLPPPFKFVTQLLKNRLGPVVMLGTEHLGWGTGRPTSVDRDGLPQPYSDLGSDYSS